MAASYSVQYDSVLVATSGNVGVGYGLTHDASGRYMVTATSANLATSSSGVIEGVSISNAQPQWAIMMKCDSRVDATLVPFVGTGNGTDYAVVDGTTGRVVRSSSLTSTTIGRCAKDGSVTLDLGLSSFGGYATLSGDVIGNPTANQLVAFTGTAGVVDARATTVQWSSETTSTKAIKTKGFLELGDFGSNTPPTSGRVRLPYNESISYTQPSGTTWGKLIYSTNALSPTFTNVIAIGTSTGTNPDPPQVTLMAASTQVRLYVVDEKVRVTSKGGVGSAGILTLVNSASYIEFTAGGPIFITGSGAPAITAPNGSFYSRTDGSSNADALYSRQGGAWYAIGASVTLGGDVTGASGANTVTKIRNVTISSTAPTNGYVLTYNSGSTQWEPQAPSVTSSVTMGGDVTGASSACTVGKIQNIAVISGTPSDGQVLAYKSSNTRWEFGTMPSSLSGDATGLFASSKVEAISGNSGTVTVNSGCGTIAWVNSSITTKLSSTTTVLTQTANDFGIQSTNVAIGAATTGGTGSPTNSLYLADGTAPSGQSGGCMYWSDSKRPAWMFGASDDTLIVDSHLGGAPSSLDESLKVIVNGNTRYIPLYTGHS